jgi:CO/xanthine dehydrogenase Mo-binding subunit
MKIDPANLRVINPYLGGGFGGKRLRTRRNHRCGDRGAAWRTLQAGGRGDMVTPAIPNLPDFSLASRLC